DGAIRQVLLPEVAAGDGSGGTTLLAAAGAALLAAIFTVIATASNLPRALTGGSLDEGGRQSGRRAAAQTGLLVLHTALSVLLLAGAGMFGRSLYKLLAQDVGINMDNVVVVDIEPGPGAGTRGDLFDAALDRIRAVPGV